MDIWNTTAITVSGIDAGSTAADAVEKRANILAMTQVAEDAILQPAEPGRWSHGLRAVLAARIANLSGSRRLAQHYLGLSDTEAYASFADPAVSSDDPGLAVCLAFTDQVAAQPRDVTPRDIAGLQQAGVADADIVRLTELIAFLGYQVRLVAGLELLKGAEQ